MINKNRTFLAIIIVIFLTIIYTIASTYAVIINVRENDGINEIINVITISDLVTNDNGTYNSTYYDVKKELNITDEEASVLMESEKLNENLQIVLKSIVDYKLNNDISAKMSNDEIYDLIVDGLNNTKNITEELKNKVISKTSIYKQDISDYLYDIDVKVIGDSI